MFPLDGFYHYGIVASDFDKTVEISLNLGLEWASVTEFEMVCEQPTE